MAPRITVIASYAPSLINFRGELLKSFEKLGFEMLLMAPGLSFELLKPLSLKQAQVMNLPMERNGINPFKDLETSYLIWRCLRQFSPDIVLAYTVKPVIYGSIAAYLAGVPKRYALLTGLGSTFTVGSRTPSHVTWIITQLYRFSLRHNTAVIFQNPDDEKLFRQEEILPSQIKSYVVNGSGVDLQMFSPSALPKSPSFLLMARLILGKGIREYVAAAKQIRLKYPEARFYLAGSIDSNPTAISRYELEEWMDAGTIEYLGYLNDVRPAISKCSIYVLPSFYREGVPRSILEAMAMGRGIITTDTPGCRETVIEGINGYLVSVQDVEALATSMEKLIVYPELQHQFGQASRRIVEEKYDVHKVNQQMLQAMDIKE